MRAPAQEWPRLAKASRGSTGGGRGSGNFPSGGGRPRGRPDRRGSGTGRRQRSSGGPRRDESLRWGRLVDGLDVPWQRLHGGCDGGRKRGIQGGLCSVRVCAGVLHISSGATRISGDAQDGRCPGSPDPQLANGVRAPEARRVRRSRNTGICFGLSIRQVVFSFILLLYVSSTPWMTGVMWGGLNEFVVWVWV